MKDRRSKKTKKFQMKLTLSFSKEICAHFPLNVLWDLFFSVNSLRETPEFIAKTPPGRAQRVSDEGAQVNESGPKRRKSLGETAAAARATALETGEKVNKFAADPLSAQSLFYVWLIICANTLSLESQPNSGYE